ncbi:organic cation transporter protein isoform X2 [Strongylocentrotus purpuratus]|uniref:Major facilitator superfamily (MFS) profile domain-containing protein n=1 Tax=Strongylocentrotus purpuratus TaxID=7668 RepID=A0A7M7PI71_STRPU|nr:organic cation transporter protein isoform X2 [Strongylocentrotus purpuratus]
MVCFISLPVSWHQMAQVFMGSKMDHWCQVSAWDNEDCSRWDYTAEQCMEAKHNASVPFNYTKEDNMFQCYKYGIVDELDFHPGLDPENYNNTDLIRCNQGWVYDKSQYKSSIISEFDLVCSHKDRDSLAQSLFFVGVLIGSVVFGGLSDIYGRRKILFVALLVQSVSGLAIAFSPSYWFYTIFRMILASANMGVFLLSFIIGTEFVGPSKRVIAGIVIMIFFSIGYMLLALFAYFIREWWILQLAITAPIFIMFAFFPFLPESVRWLISKGRTEEATRIIKKAADVNKAKLPEPIFTPEDIKEQEAAATGRQATAIDLFRTPNLRIRTLNLMFNWFVNTLVYYGLSLSTSDLGVNVYIAFFISGAVEFPAYISCIFAIEYFGRKWSMFGYMVGGGIACLCTIFTPIGAWRTTVAMIGKFGISASFAIVYIYSAELFPTPVRSVGVGICSMSARIAGILAPIILLLDDTWEPFPVLIFGVMSIAAGLLVLFLPETRGEQLPETLEEGEMFGTKPKEYEVKTEPRFQYKNDANSGVINQAFDQEIEQGKVIS